MSATREFACRVRLLGADGVEMERFGARLGLDAEAIALQPDAGAPSRVELAEVDFLLPGDHLFSLALDGGARLEFSMLGRRFDEALNALSQRLRDLQNKALLLDEAEGGEAFEGEFRAAGSSGAAELRLYLSRLSIFPRAHVPVAIALGEVERAAFDEDRYATILSLRGGGEVVLSRLGRDSKPFAALLDARLTALRSRMGDALGALATGSELSFMQRRQLAALMPDGVPASRRALDAAA